MADVFISYSRKDKEFVQTLHAALSQSHYETWIDWQDIPASAEWWAEIEAGIAASNTFVFVISPDSVSSKVCHQEIDYAISHQKRLLAVVRRDVEGLPIHPALSKHNWLFFRQEDDFDTAFRALVEAINTDLAHVRAHTRLLVRAKEWDSKGRNDSLLLRGDDLREAEQWLKQNENKAPLPTEQHKNYIHKSREAENASRRAKQMVAIGAGAMSVMLAIALISVIWARQDIAAKNREAQEASERAEQAAQQEKAALARAQTAEEEATRSEAEAAEVLTSLNNAKAELETTQNNLKTEKQNVQAAQQELNRATAELGETKQALAAAQQELEGTRREVAAGDSRLTLLQRTQADLDRSQREVRQLREELRQCQAPAEQTN
jgi:DNA repair exonuclease SbcCD ATPase subunit